jgi:hypothetical protein
MRCFSFSGIRSIGLLEILSSAILALRRTNSLKIGTRRTGIKMMKLVRWYIIILAKGMVDLVR